MGISFFESTVSNDASVLDSCSFCCAVLFIIYSRSGHSIVACHDVKMHMRGLENTMSLYKGLSCEQEAESKKIGFDGTIIRRYS